MALFMTRKKREQIGDEIDDLLMRQYHHRCKLEEAQQAGNEERVQYEKNKYRRGRTSDSEIKKKACIAGVEML